MAEVSSSEARYKTSVPEREDVSIDEIVRLGAVDTEVFAQGFFPRAFRQDSPPWAGDIWDDLDNPHIRLYELLAFRGSAKTTRVRVFAAKRISYGMSRTILIIGAREDKAFETVGWLKRNIERNKLWTQTFGLARGTKWEESQIEIVQTIPGEEPRSVWVLGAGILGSLRGVNFDDYRPDLILVDDPQNDEMAESELQVLKTKRLLMGAVYNSLAPEVDEPNAKLIMAATPMARNDVTQSARDSESWFTRLVPCWTPGTLYDDVDKQVSSWPSRFPTKNLQKQKRSAAADNELSVFTREMEVRIVSSETAQFQKSWLRVREEPGETHRGCFAVLGIDPVPPPSPRQIATGLRKKDFEAQYVWGRVGNDYHLLDCARNRGHDPSWSVTTGLALAHKWRVARIVVETIAYQRVLKWFFEQEMRRRGLWFSVVDAPGQHKSTFAKIVGVLHGLSTQRRLVIGQEHTIFASQYEEYANVEHDDDLMASAIALSDLANPYLELDSPGSRLLEASMPDMENSWMSCP